jgi:hypothetical protein
MLGASNEPTSPHFSLFLLIAQRSGECVESEMTLFFYEMEFNSRCGRGRASPYRERYTKLSYRSTYK